jgi:hypothetical protein
VTARLRSNAPQEKGIDPQQLCLARQRLAFALRGTSDVATVLPNDVLLVVVAALRPRGPFRSTLPPWPPQNLAQRVEREVVVLPTIAERMHIAELVAAKKRAAAAHVAAKEAQAVHTVTQNSWLVKKGCVLGNPM